VDRESADKMKLSKSFDELILNASRLSLNNLRSPAKKKGKNVMYSRVKS